MRIRDRLSFYKFVLTKNMAEQAQFDCQNFKTAHDILCAYTGDIAGKTVLDIGCGRLYPQTLLFHSVGAVVTSIDHAYIGVNDPVCLRYWRSLIQGGLDGFGRDVLYTLLGKNKTYYQRLGSLMGFELSSQGLDIVQMAVENMSFPDNAFDIAIPNDAFEHIADVPKAISQVYRVLKKGAIIYIGIHLFASLSGGHHPDYMNTDKIPP
jgi:SAM-dependent methyltransferase